MGLIKALSRCLLSGAMLLAGSAVVFAEEPVELLFFDPSGVIAPRDVFEDELERILADASIEIRLLEPSGNLEITGRDVPIVATVFEQHADRFGLSVRVLGVMAMDESDRKSIFVFFPAIVQTLGLDPMLAKTDAGKRLYSRAAARVLVHEIVHSVLPHRPHTSSGLMKRCLTRRALRQDVITLDHETARLLAVALTESVRVARDETGGRGTDRAQ